MTCTLPEAALSFGPFSLDLANARLARGRRPVALTPKALAVLHYLATRPGRLVTKEELLANLWPDVVVCDASIKVCVGEIRKALADRATEPTYIQTVHRRGYRFIATVRDATASEPEPAAPVDSESPVVAARSDVAPAPTPSPRFIVGEDDLRLLRAAFDAAAASGRRQCILISVDAKGAQVLFL
jgi:DNA-binding winged helix-turn-helix (wHTH) protein